MKGIIIKLFYLLIVPGMIILLSLFLPPNGRFKKSLMFAQLDKNMLLEDTKGKRIIFIGGSNLSFGLDSKMIKDSLNINPINTGVSAGFGLKFMIANASTYIREKDIIVLSPEYHQFYGDFADGDLDLLSVIVDVSRPSIKLLDCRQIYKLCKYIPEFTASKMSGFFKSKYRTNDSIGIYDRLAFNTFGDVYIHWKLPKQKFPVYDFKGDFNEDIIHSLIQFKDLVKSKGAKLFFTFPCLEEASFEFSKKRISEVEKKLNSCGFVLISKPEEYKMTAGLMFNTAYHLNREGVVLRTRLLINDLKIALN